MISTYFTVFEGEYEFGINRLVKANSEVHARIVAILDEFHGGNE